jgi:hypothetical protein
LKMIIFDENRNNIMPIILQTNSLIIKN